MQDHKKAVDPELLAHCIVTEVEEPPPFYPEELKTAANSVLVDNFGFTQEGITLEIAEDVYKFLIHEIEEQ